MLRHSSFRYFFPVIHRTLRTSTMVRNGKRLTQTPEEEDRVAFEKSSISVAEFMDVKPTLPKFSQKFQDFDVLRDAIKKSKSINEILTIVRLNKDTMEAPQINAAVSSLTRLRHAEKDLDSKESDEQILTNPEFQLLCKILVQRIRTLNTQHLISSLLFIDTFNISIKTTVAQSVLQLIRQKINDFEVRQICFLHSTVVRIKDSHSIDDVLLNAVILALPMVFEIKVANNLLDFSNTTELVSCIRFAVHHKLRPEILNKLMDAVIASKNLLNSYECFHLKESLDEKKISGMDLNEELAKSIVHFVQDGAKAWEMKSEKELVP